MSEGAKLVGRYNKRIVKLAGLDRNELKQIVKKARVSPKSEEIPALKRISKIKLNGKTIVIRDAIVKELKGAKGGVINSLPELSAIR